MIGLMKFLRRKRVAVNPAQIPLGGGTIRKGLEACELLEQMPDAQLCRKKGAITKRYTGTQIFEAALELQTCGIKLLKDTRGFPKNTLLQRRAIATQVRELRNMTDKFC
jgi:hypothetical protein